MAKRKRPPADTWLADFRESAGLTPPPRTLSNAASRLVDLLDEFLYSLRCGWDIPPGFPRDRFVPTVYGKRDLVAPIVQYLVDLGFTGDARRLHEATRRFYAHRDWNLMTPSPGDEKGWKEFHKRYVLPLWDKGTRLQGVICDVRQLIFDMGGKTGAQGAAGGKERRRGPIPIHDPQADAKLLRDWQAAKRQGNDRKQFCSRRLGIKLKDLVGAQKRIRERRQRERRRRVR